MIGDHQRDSHSASRRVTRSPYSSSSGAFDSYQLRALPAGRLVERRRRAPARARRTARAARRGRTPTARPGWTIPYILLKPSEARATMCVAGLLVRVRAGDVGLVDVDLGLAVDHQLGDRLAGARALLDPDRGGRPQAADLGRLAEQRHPVVGDRQHAVDRVLHADGLVADDLRHQLERDLHLRVEVVLRERQLGRAQRRLLDRRDLVGVEHDRAVGVGADLEAGALLALVHVRVHVADDRVLDHRRSCPANRGTGPMSIIWWTIGVSGIEAPAIRAIRGLQAPQAITTRSASMSPRVVRTRVTRPLLDVDPEHLGVGRRPSSPPAAARSRMIVAGPQRVDDAGARRVEAAEDQLLVDERDELLDLAAGVSIDTGSIPHDLRRRHPPRQLLHPLLGRARSRSRRSR